MAYLLGFKYKFSKSLSSNFLKLSCLVLGHSGGLRGLYEYAVFSSKMKDSFDALGIDPVEGWGETQIISTTYFLPSVHFLLTLY